MEFEDLIKRYPDGIHHKTTHAECVKLESLLSSSNLAKQKTRLPKLAPFLVSSILHSEEQTMTVAVNNIRTCVPYIQDYLQTLILQELNKIQANMKESLEKSGNPARALLVWRSVVYVLGAALHKNRTAVNTLLIIPEKAFKSSIPAVQKNAFLSWKELIDNFALNPEIIAHAKRVKLILQPLMSNKSKAEEVHLARASTWWHLAFKLQDKLSVEFEKVCVPLLRFVFQLPSESGKISNSGSEAESQCSRALLLKGSEILLRILELPGQTFPAGLTSPKKMPSITAAPLAVPVSHLTIAKNISLILEVTKKSLLFLNSLQPGCPLAQAVIQMLLIRINQLSKEKVQIEVDAVAECIQFIHICVKENLVQSGLKLVDNVTRLLSSKVLTSHCYHRASNSTEVMNGVPALGFLEILLSNMVFATGNSQRFVSVFNRLVIAGVDETDFYLSFAQSVLDKLKNLCSQDGKLSPENVDIIMNLWTHTSNALWRRIQKTQEVNQGDSLEHNFSCLLAALTLPLKVQMISQKALDSKEDTKSWSNLCKAFMRCAALVVNTEANAACEELCTLILQMINQETQFLPSVLGWVSSALEVLLGSVDFQSVNTMQTVSMLSSPEGWRKRQQQPLGNLTSCVKLLEYTLTTGYNLHKKATLEQGPLEYTMSTCLRHCKTLFTSVSLSSALVSLVNILSPALIPYYSKGSETKKLSSYIKLLEQTWHSIVSAFLLHYKGLHSQDTFDVLYPLLEPTLLHPHRPIQEKSRNLWVSAFADTYSTLNFPDSFKAVLKEVRPALIPGSQISSIDTITSFDQSLEEEDMARTSSKRKKSLAVAVEEQESAKKEALTTPKSVRKGTRRDRTISVEEEFVVIPPSNKSTKRVLTEHQKEVLKQKSPIPAMYSDLTQDTQMTQDTLTEDSVSVDTSSKPESSKPVEIPDSEDPVNTEAPTVNDNDTEIPVIDITSSSSATIVNSLPCTIDVESVTMESTPKETVHSPPDKSPDLLSDDSQLSGTDSPIVLPSGISSKEVRMPKRVKRDNKLKSASAEIVLIRLPPESPVKIVPEPSVPSEKTEQHVVKEVPVTETETTSPTKRSKRKHSKKKNSEKTLQATAESKDKENSFLKLPETVENATPSKKDQPETVPVTRRRTKEILAETPRKVSSEKKQKTGKRKGQNSDQDNVKKKSKPDQNGDKASETVEIPSDTANQTINATSQELLTELGANSDSSNIEILNEVVAKSKEVETMCIEESVSDEPVVDFDVNEDLNDIPEEGMQEDFVPEAQEIVPSFPGGDEGIEKVDGENEEQMEGFDVLENEEQTEGFDVVEDEGNEQEMITGEDEEAVVQLEESVNEGEEAVDEAEAEETAEEQMQDKSAEIIDEAVELPENEQINDSKSEEQTTANASSTNSPEHPSQNIVEFLTEELPISQTSVVTRKRKASSPIRSSSNRTIMTVGVGSRWKVKNSPNKKLDMKEASKNSCKAADQVVVEEEDNNEVSSKFTKDEKENTSIISNEARVVLEPLVMTPGKVKPALISLSRKKALRSPVSPMSRSQRMLEAAMKTRSADVEPTLHKSGGHVPMHSPPSRNEHYVYSPSASPSNSILKVKSQVSEKPTSPQNGQKRRVSFADPPVKDNQPVNSINSSCHRSLQDDAETALKAYEEMEGDSEKSVLTEQDLQEPEVLEVDSQSPIYPELLGCTDSIQAVLTQITSSLWSRGLDKLLRSKNVNTIGDLSALTYPEVVGLPIVTPKVKTLRSVLAKYHQHQTRLESGDSKLHSERMLTIQAFQETEDVQQEGDMEAYEPEDEKDDNNALEGENKEEEPMSGTQDLWITQGPSHTQPSTQEEEEEEEAEMEESASSPPLQSLEEALNNNLLPTSMLEENTDFSSFLINEKRVLEEDPGLEQQLAPTVIDEETSSDHCEVPTNETESRADVDAGTEDCITVLSKSFASKVKDFIKEMTTKELVDAMFIIQNSLRTKVL